MQRISDMQPVTGFVGQDSRSWDVVSRNTRWRSGQSGEPITIAETELVHYHDIARAFLAKRSTNFFFKLK